MRLFEFGMVYRYEKSGVTSRAHPGAGLHAGRQPHLLHPRPAAGRAGLAPRVRAAPAARPSGSTTSEPTCRPATPRRWWAPPSSGTWPRPRSRRPSSRPASTMRSCRARRRSTPRRSTSTSATPSAARGSCRRSRSTSSCPERFDLEYVDADNQRHRPIVIHRALFGSVERFFAILLEHYAGAFPTWLSPVQVTVLPGGRGPPRPTPETRGRPPRGRRLPGGAGRRPTSGLGGRIRKAKMTKVPHVVVVGADDVDAGTVGRQRPGRRGARRRASRSTTSSTGCGPRSSPTASAAAAAPGRLERLWAGWRIDLHRAAPATPDQPGRAAACSARLFDSDRPDEDTCVVWRDERVVAAPQRLPVQAAATCWCCPAATWPIWPSSTAEERAALWGAVHDAVRGDRRPPTGPEGVNVGANLGRGGRRRHPRPPPRPRAAPLGRRHQLHDVGGRDQGAPRGARDHLAKLRDAWPDV